MRNDAMRDRGSFVLHVMPLVIYCGVIFLLSSFPVPSPPNLGIDWGDKIVHAGAFGLMTLFGYRAWRWILKDRSRIPSLTAAFLFSALYGALDEYHQSLVPGRLADINDWIADITGAALALVLLSLTQKRQ